jgi:hypothetical protein
MSPKSGRENDDDQDHRKEGLRLRLQDPQHHRRLPLQPLHLQDLRLLKPRGPR